MGSFFGTSVAGGAPPNPLSSSSLGVKNGYIAQAAPIQGQDFTGQLANAGSMFQTAYGNEGSLATALQNQMNGSGINPAVAQAQNMNENAIKSNAGMVASQKGISPALAERMASQNSANMQQQAAGQGAQLSMQGQLNAQQALQNLYGTQANQAAGQQSTLQNALAAYNNANVGMQSNLNNTNEAASAQNAATQAGLIGGAMQGASSLMSLSKGGVVPTGAPQPVQKFDTGGGVMPAAPMQSWGMNLMPQVDNDAVMAMANQYIQAGGQALDKGLSSMGSSMSPSKIMGGGEQDGTSQAGGPGDLMDSTGGAMSPGAEMGGEGAGGISGIASLAMLANKGAVIPDHMQHMAKLYHPDFAGNAKLKSSGGSVPGKAAVKGDSPKNDTVPTMLSPGEIVLPRSVTQSKDPAKAAADFVAEKLKGTNHTADFHDALARAVKTRRSK